jgi:hypothetical protein
VNGAAPIEPWAKVPESAIGLNATEHDVFVVYSSKAGRTREAWVSQATAAMLITREREAKGKPGVSRQTVGRSVKRLLAHDLIREAGIVVNGDGVWTKKYEVAPYLGVAHPEGASSGSDAHFDGRDAHLGANDAHPGRAQSSASKAVPLDSESSDEELNTKHVPDNPWCRCPDCGKSEEQEPHREQRNREATPPARVAIPAEEVARER